MPAQTRLEEKNAAIAQMQRSESITAQLMERLEKDQAGQVERMNRAIQMSEEMVRIAPCCSWLLRLANMLDTLDGL